MHGFEPAPAECAAASSPCLSPPLALIRVGFSWVWSCVVRDAGDVLTGDDCGHERSQFGLVTVCWGVRRVTGPSGGGGQTVDAEVEVDVVRGAVCAEMMERIMTFGMMRELISGNPRDRRVRGWWICTAT